LGQGHAAPGPHEPPPGHGSAQARRRRLPRSATVPTCPRSRPPSSSWRSSRPAPR
jgi:hypothetical protein